VNLGIGDRRAAFEEVEIAAQIRLRHMLREKRAIAAAIARRRRAPGGAARGEHRIIDLERQAAGGDVEGDDATSIARKLRYIIVLGF
jgi:hypothetical protein